MSCTDEEDKQGIGADEATGMSMISSLPSASLVMSHEVLEGRIIWPKWNLECLCPWGTLAADSHKQLYTSWMSLFLRRFKMMNFKDLLLAPVADQGLADAPVSDSDSPLQ